MRALLLAGLTCAMFAVAGCGDRPTDGRVAEDVKGSGQKQLLDDFGFINALRLLGVRPDQRPPAALGESIGRRLRAALTDAGRLYPGSYTPAAERRLRKLGTLSRAQFERRYGTGPRDMADRMATVIALLDYRLDERADPPPAIARGLLKGFGTDGKDVATGDAATFVRDVVVGLLPAAGGPTYPVDDFRRQYVFVLNISKM